MKKKTTKEFKEEVYKQVGNEYTVLGQYVNNKTKILFKHNKCGNEYLVSPNNFINNKTRCPRCNGGIKKDIKWFKEEVYKQVVNEYSVLGQYINIHKKLLIKHNKCNYEFMVSPNNFINNKTRCPRCNGGINKTTKEFKKEVYNLYKDEYSVLGQYYNQNTEILIQHKCGYQYKIKPKLFLNHNSMICPVCSTYSNMINTEVFKRKVYNLVGYEYSLLGQYKDHKTKILLRHNKCGYEYSVSPNNFISMNNRCPKCFFIEHRSNEEKSVVNYIKSIYKDKIIESDRTILSNNQELDVYLPNDKIAIEYNGLYWHSNKFHNANYHLNKTIECENNNINYYIYLKMNGNLKIILSN